MRAAATGVSGAFGNALQQYMTGNAVNGSKGLYSAMTNNALGGGY